MMTLGLDTSGRYLNIALLEGDKLIDQVHEECYRHQSELLLPRLQEILGRNGRTPEDIGAIVITEGPGSYTGIRIAMTFAKVFAREKGIPLYKLDSLQLIAGKVPTTAVYLDARAQRGYFGVFTEGKAMMADTIITEAEFRQYRTDHADDEFRGDLPGWKDSYDDINQHFADLRSEWLRVDPIDPLGAKYLKEAAEYLVKR